MPPQIPPLPAFTWPSAVSRTTIVPAPAIWLGSKGSARCPSLLEINMKSSRLSFTGLSLNGRTFTFTTIMEPANFAASGEPSACTISSFVVSAVAEMSTTSSDVSPTGSRLSDARAKHAAMESNAQNLFIRPPTRIIRRGVISWGTSLILKPTMKSLLLAVLLTSALSLQAADWPAYGHDPQRTGWAVDENTIKPENVAQLELKWKTKVKNQSYQLSALTAPVVAAHVSTSHGERPVAYVAGTNNHVFALDVETGEVLWEHDFHSHVRSAPGGFQQTFLCP